MRKWLGLVLAATTATSAWGQARQQVANPVQNLPQVETPKAAPNITFNVQQQQQNTQLATLLAITLTPSHINIVGAHSIPFDEVSALFKPLTGKTVRIADLVAAADACSKLYQQHGYALSFCYVPAQTFDNGVVNVTVVEGYVAEVVVSGDAGSLSKKINAIASHITADRPLRKATFERYIQVLGMLPGAKIAANVPVPTTTDGATRLELQVTRKRFNSSAGIDFNHPGIQGLLNGMLNGLTPLGEQITASVIYPQGHVSQEFYAAGYSQMLGSSGLIGKLDGSHFYGNPDISTQLPSYLRHRLTQDRLALNVSYPLWLSPSRSLLVNASAYASNQNDSYLNKINGASLQFKTKLRVLQAGLDYTQASAKQVRKFSFGISHGFDIWGAGTNTVSNIPGTNLSAATDTRFTRYNVSALQGNTWGAHIGTVASLIGQYSNNRLPSSEQISFGGPRFGLAYDPGSVSGDSGWGAALEVNRPFTYPAKWLKTLTPYTVAQFARVYQNSGQPTFDELKTIALGMRLTDGKHYTVDFSAAQPVGTLPLNSSGRHPRYNLSFSYQLE
ncbi:ShlB/FhaC/HecB family hemolysin secretion/activation protein [Dyella tabacisoli]|uniref:ShlB/FhaC/HecB family hemolysin secretion/activation protein n=1 Tax=Dyella tabacisoli TaxID=2282381 RepID=A0A369USQ8_9GAMM|nr:POTRA domain-containing protein [Dyella tabacisoli]RDD83507.1 ShlB/FhaC/HecB family hemolysin secretion/activation protein [Dyella tabacisoli]